MSVRSSRHQEATSRSGVSALEVEPRIRGFARFDLGLRGTRAPAKDSSVSFDAHMKDIVPAPPPITRNEVARIQALFQHVVPSYGRFDIVLSHSAGSYLYD